MAEASEAAEQAVISELTKFLNSVIMTKINSVSGNKNGSEHIRGKSGFRSIGRVTILIGGMSASINRFQ